MEKSKTILVVDDVPMFRDLATLFLARTARVIQASGGEQALALLADHTPDLLIVDLHMPGMDGAELCRTVKADPKTEHLPVIMMLRGDSAADRERAIQAAADDTLTKPLARGALIETVHHFLEAGLSRGLPRVGIAAPVQLRSPLMHAWGTALNISRGGIYVEADCELEEKARLTLEILLPETTNEIAPLAEVIWSRESEDERVQEIGMRFLSIDDQALRTLDDFISDNIDGIMPLAP
jgi:two-component system cell cycle response regulator